MVPFVVVVAIDQRVFILGISWGCSSIQGYFLWLWDIVDPQQIYDFKLCLFDLLSLFIGWIIIIYLSLFLWTETSSFIRFPIKFPVSPGKQFYSSVYTIGSCVLFCWGIGLNGLDWPECHGTIYRMPIYCNSLGSQLTTN